MTILHITESLGGGVYSYFKDMSTYISKELNKKEIRNILIYSPNRKEFNLSQAISELSESFELIEISMEREIKPLKDFRSFNKLKNKISELDPDIIHLHSSKAGVLGRLAAFDNKNVKLFYTPHGFSFARKDISFFKRKAFHIIEKIISQIFGGTIIACGDTEFEYSKKITANSILVRNGVNIENIPPGEPSVTTTPTIGILGRITEARNPELFNNIASEFPHLKFKWIGDGNLRSKLTAKNIEITGWFDNRSEGLKELKTLDIYIQTSLWEGLPFSVIEAMVLKKPVIASNIIGNKDIVIHGKTGFLYDSKKDLIKQLNLLIKDRRQRENFGEEGYKRVIKTFNSVKNFNTLFQEVYFK